MTASPHPSATDQAGAHLLQLTPTLFQGLGGWVAIPSSIDPGIPVLVAVHGVGRDARNQATLFAQQAALQGRVVVAPLFDEQQWPGYQRLGTPGRRADLALIRLLELIAFQWRVNTRRVYLFGYSGGAQFAHRFALLHPHRIAQLGVCASGWFTWPTDDPYPLGLGEGAGPLAWLGQAARNNFARFLQVPTQVFVGSRDCVADDKTRSSARIDQLQGTHRLERGRRWVEALSGEARRRGLEPRAELTVLPGTGHDFRECLASGELLQKFLPAVDRRQGSLPQAA